MTLDILAELKDLKETLDFHLQRHGVLASNLANAETPGYIPKDMSFKDTLDTVKLEATQEGHMALEAPTGQVVETEATDLRQDGNGVRLEQAMAQIGANRLRYETGIELARRRIAILRYAASDGSSG